MNLLKESKILQKLALNVLKIKADYNRKPNKRVKIDVGLKCNYSCIFCYYKNHLKENFKSLDIIKQKILSLYNCGFHEFDLSGGECTIHPNFFDILQYIRSLNSSVSVVSNGFKFSDINFCKKCQQYGLNEVLFSLHSIKDNHNYITQNKFSFDNCLKGILNCQSLGFKVRINCTLCDINYKYLKDYINLINDIKPFELNFILFNYNDDQKQTSSINLKDICNEYGVFIMTATQLNSDYTTAQQYDQNLLRGAKSIADKIDYGAIMLQTSQEDKEALKPILLKQNLPEPVIKISVYKNRRGQYKDILLWCKADRGICRIEPMFATTYNYELVDLPDLKIKINPSISASAF